MVIRTPSSAAAAKSETVRTRLGSPVSSIRVGSEPPAGLVGAVDPAPGRRGVQGAVDAASGQCADAFGHALAVGGHLGADRFQGGGPSRPGGGDHPNTLVQREAHRRLTHGGARAVDEQQLTRLDAEVVERAPRRLGRHRQRGGLFGGDAAGDACPGRHQRVLGGTGRRAVEGGRAEHAVADLDAVDALAERVDGASTSRPSPRGSGGRWSARRPSTTCQSAGVRPHARTAIRIWPGPGTGCGTSRSTITSGEPNRSNCRAFMTISWLITASVVIDRTS